MFKISLQRNFNTKSGLTSSHTQIFEPSKKYHINYRLRSGDNNKKNPFAKTTVKQVNSRFQSDLYKLRNTRISSIYDNLRHFEINRAKYLTRDLIQCFSNIANGVSHLEFPNETAMMNLKTLIGHIYGQYDGNQSNELHRVNDSLRGICIYQSRRHGFGDVPEEHGNRDFNDKSYNIRNPMCKHNTSNDCLSFASLLREMGIDHLSTRDGALSQIEHEKNVFSETHNANETPLIIADKHTSVKEPEIVNNTNNKMYSEEEVIDLINNKLPGHFYYGNLEIMRNIPSVDDERKTVSSLRSELYRIDSLHALLHDITTHIESMTSFDIMLLFDSLLKYGRIDKSFYMGIEYSLIRISHRLNADELSFIAFVHSIWKKGYIPPDLFNEIYTRLSSVTGISDMSISSILMSATAFSNSNNVIATRANSKNEQVDQIIHQKHLNRYHRPIKYLNYLLPYLQKSIVNLTPIQYSIFLSLYANWHYSIAPILDKSNKRILFSDYTASPTRNTHFEAMRFNISIFLNHLSMCNGIYLRLMDIYSGIRAISSIASLLEKIPRAYDELDISKNSDYFRTLPLGNRPEHINEALFLSRQVQSLFLIIISQIEKYNMKHLHANQLAELLKYLTDYGIVNYHEKINEYINFVNSVISNININELHFKGASHLVYSIGKSWQLTRNGQYGYVFLTQLEGGVFNESVKDNNNVTSNTDTSNNNNLSNTNSTTDITNSQLNIDKIRHLFKDVESIFSSQPNIRDHDAIRQIIHGYYLVNSGSLQFWESMQHFILQNLSELSPLAISTICRVFGENRIGLNFFDHVQFDIISRINQFSQGHFVDILYGYSVLNIDNVQLFELILSLLRPSRLFNNEKCALLFPVFLNLQVKYPTSLNTADFSRYGGYVESSFRKYLQVFHSETDQMKNVLNFFKNNKEFNKEFKPEYNGILGIRGSVLHRGYEVDIYLPDSNIGICFASDFLHNIKGEPSGLCLLRNRWLTEGVKLYQVINISLLDRRDNNEILKEIYREMDTNILNNYKNKSIFKDSPKKSNNPIQFNVDFTENNNIFYDRFNDCEKKEQKRDERGNHSRIAMGNLVHSKDDTEKTKDNPIDNTKNVDRTNDPMENANTANNSSVSFETFDKIKQTANICHSVHRDFHQKFKSNISPSGNEILKNHLNYVKEDEEYQHLSNLESILTNGDNTEPFGQKPVSHGRRKRRIPFSSLEYLKMDDSLPWSSPRYQVSDGKVTRVGRKGK